MIVQSSNEIIECCLKLSSKRAIYIGGFYEALRARSTAAPSQGDVNKVFMRIQQHGLSQDSSSGA